MRNLLPVLKKLGKKMTGEDIVGKNLVTVVDDIAEKYTGGSGGGGEGGDQDSDVFWVKFSYNDETGNLDQCDKTYNEIIQAYNSRKLVRGYIEDAIYDDNSQVIGTEVNSVFDFDGKTGTLSPTIMDGVSFSFIQPSFQTYVEPPELIGLQCSIVFISENNELYFNTGNFSISAN